MARTNDFAFVFRGGVNGKLLPFDLNVKGGRFIDTKLYEAAKQNKKGARQLVSISTGTSGDDLASDVAKLMALILSKTGGDLQTIGAFCAVGSSNGCSLVLALAAELKEKTSPQLTYIGCTNVTIIPLARDPSVAKIGDLKPTIAPKFTTLKNRVAIPKLDNPRMDKEDPPVIKLKSEIDAKQKRNFYEKLGNRARYLGRNHPLEPNGRGWWWTSGMFANEVHGEIEGFDNEKPFSATGATDFDLHADVCDNGPFQQMLDEASSALANLPD